MMLRRLLIAALVLILLLPPVVLAQQKTRATGTGNTTTSGERASSAPQAASRLQTSQTERPQPPACRRSYGRETGRWHRGGISKKEVAFMAAIAGTSLGVGALAGGAKGLVIGSIVGSWGAYAGHRVWKWLR